MRCAKLCCYSTLCLLVIAWTISASAAIVSIPAPFVGDLSESFESFPNYNITGVTPQPPYSIMGGAATVSGNFLLVMNPGVGAAWTLGGNGNVVVPDGVQALGNNNSASLVTVSFDSPISDFGAYWGKSTNGVLPNVDVTFYDASNTIVGTDSFSYSRPGDGILEWHGFASSIPFTSLTYFADVPAVDFFQANLFVAPIPAPEPSSLFLLGCAIGVAGVRRREKAQMRTQNQGE